MVQKRWLKNTRDGEIYAWNSRLVGHPLLREVTEEQAFPEKFKPKKQVARKSKISLETENIPRPENELNKALGDELGKMTEAKMDKIPGNPRAKAASRKDARIKAMEKAEAASRATVEKPLYPLGELDEYISSVEENK